MKTEKQIFIKAYSYMYGEPKHIAEKVYRQVSPEYIAAIVEGMRMETHKAFYED